MKGFNLCVFFASSAMSQRDAFHIVLIIYPYGLVSVFVKVQGCYELETFICSKCQNMAELQFASLSPLS